MKLPRAILFDLDDTLLVAFGPAESQWRRVIGGFAERLGAAVRGRGDCRNPAELQRIVGRSGAAQALASPHRRGPPAHRRRRIRRVGGLGPRRPRRAFGDLIADQYNTLHDAELRLFPQAHETLHQLKQQGVRLALITNGAAEPQRAKVVRFALAERFDHVQIEGEHGFGKPEERAYTHAMSALGVGPGETWMVGDNLEWEIAAPQRLGIHAIWHDGYGTGLPPGCPVRPDRIIRTLPELLL